MNGFVIFAKPPPDASEANAMSSTTTRPFTLLGLGSFLGVANESSARFTRRIYVMLAFDEDGLIPVVVQDRLTGEVRMVAYANEEAVRLTRETKRATFWSRSRKEIWEKGKTSGNHLLVDAVLSDCDEDCLVYQVTPHGPTCHTGAESCFFRRADDDERADEKSDPPAPTTLMRLDRVLEERKASTAGKSYTKSLYEGGPPRIGEKLREEADELARALASEADDRVSSEAADVLFHVMVALRARGISFTSVLQELDRRAGTSGHDEKRARRT